MIANTLVFVCAAFGLVAGSCFEITAPQCSSQVIAIPTQNEAVFSSGEQTPVVIAAPAASDIFSSGSSSDDSFSGIFSSGSSSGSSFGVPSNGPESSPLSVITAPSVTLPAVEGPVVTLSSQPIPAPRVLSQRCICTKTIVKPQVIQRTVTVPKVQRYLKRTVSPVVENVAYKSTPISQESSSSSGSGALFISGSNSGSSSSSGSAAVLISGSNSGSSSGSSSPVVFSSESGSSPQTRYVAAPVVVSSGSSRCY